MGLFSGLGKLFKGVAKIVAPVVGAASGGWVAPLVGAGASLLGGAKEASDNRDAVRAQNAYNDPAAVRARYEAAGFNPTLAFGGTTIGQQTALAGSTFGQSVANAGAIVADELFKRSDVVQKNNELEKQNEDLKKRLVDSTLRPQVAGVYGATTQQSVARAQAAKVAPPRYDEPIGPRKDVSVTNLLNGRGMKLPPQLADQLNLRDGDYWTAETDQAIFGDWFGEAKINSDVATAFGKNIFGYGDNVFDTIRYDDGSPYAAEAEAKKKKADQSSKVTIPDNWRYQ